MTDLSPAAQAVLDAFCEADNGVYLEGDPERLAAALRAAADALVAHEYWDRYPAIFYRKKLLAIATELENQ